MKRRKIDKYKVATFIALVVHLGVFIGMFTSKYNWFVSFAPISILIMFGLIVWTQDGKNASFFAFILICFAVGMASEMIGVNTGFLVGQFEYGKMWRGRINNVPWLLGLNWFTIVYCCGVIMTSLQERFQQKLTAAGGELSPRIQWASFIADGAMLATFYDYILEPAAVKLGYWTWLEDSIPFSNYLCWFVISAALLAVFKVLSFPRHNQFAVHLLIIQLLFFSALRTFL